MLPSQPWFTEQACPGASARCLLSGPVTHRPSPLPTRTPARQLSSIPPSLVAPCNSLLNSGGRVPRSEPGNQGAPLPVVPLTAAAHTTSPPLLSLLRSRGRNLVPSPEERDAPGSLAPFTLPLSPRRVMVIAPPTRRRDTGVLTGEEGRIWPQERNSSEGTGGRLPRGRGGAGSRAEGSSGPAPAAGPAPCTLTFVARAADLHKLLHLHLDLLRRRLGGGLLGLLGCSPGPAGRTDTALRPLPTAAKATGPGAGSRPALPLEPGAHLHGEGEGTGLATFLLLSCCPLSLSENPRAPHYRKASTLGEEGLQPRWVHPPVSPRWPEAPAGHGKGGEALTSWSDASCPGCARGNCPAAGRGAHDEGQSEQEREEEPVSVHRAQDKGTRRWPDRQAPRICTEHNETHTKPERTSPQCRVSEPRDPEVSPTTGDTEGPAGLRTLRGNGWKVHTGAAL